MVNSVSDLSTDTCNEIDCDLIKKKEIIYDCLVREYELEMARSNALDDKAFKSLSTNAFLFGFLPIMIKWGPSGSSSVNFLNSPFALFFFIIICLSLLAVWLLLLKVILLIGHGQVSLSLKDLEELPDQTVASVYDRLCNTYRSINSALTTQLAKKSCILRYAHMSPILSGIFYFLLILCLFTKPSFVQ